jgi:hypothetical protein
MKTFGSDPELMLFRDGEPWSAIGVIQGNIENRIDLNGHQFYYDNVLAECAIKPGNTKEEVVENFRECLQIFADMVDPLEIVAQASAIFSNSQLNHPDARRVGCAKDFCAYEMKQKEGPVEEILQGNLRSCGGHIHLGADVLTTDGPEPVLAVYVLDLFLGVPSLWLDNDPTSAKRRSLYGHAGRYRVKPYGIEYRSLGNFWLQSPELVGLIYDLAMFSLEFVETGKAWDLWEFNFDRFLESNEMSDAWKCTGYDPESLLCGINQTDKNVVEKHFEIAKKLMPRDLKYRIENSISRYEKTDMYSNWNIK